MNIQELDLVVIKHVLVNKNNAIEFTNECDEKLFSSDLWKFSKTIIDYIRNYKEVPTRKVINERLKSSNNKNDSVIKYINGIWDDLDKIEVDPKEYKHDLEKIKHRFIEKLIIDLKDNLVGIDGRVDITKSVAELTSAVKHIKGVNQVKAYEQKSLKESIDDFRSRYIAKQQDSNFYGGYKTGYDFLDDALGSIRKTEMLIIAAESGVGKSLLMMNIGLNMWLGKNNIDMESDFSLGADVLYFSLEMPYQDMQDRVIACLAKVPQIGIRDATLDADQKKSVARTMKFIEKYPHDFTIVDIPRGATMESVEAIFNEICETKRKPQIVIIDYLALLSPSQKDLSDWLNLNYLSEAVHEFGRVNDVVTITASQLNRPPQNKATSEQTNGLHRLSRSSLIAANANFVMIIEKRPNEQHLPNMQLHLIKSRRSPLVSGTVHKQLEYCALLNTPVEEGFKFDVTEDGEIIDPDNEIN